MNSKKYYDNHVDSILTRSLIYYEKNKEKVLVNEEKVKYTVDDIIITDKNYRRIQKMNSKKYYDKHVDSILKRSLLYYEKNKEKV